MKNLTVVIPFCNGHRTISRLLKSLPNGVPVIVIDDLSDEPLRITRRGVTVVRMERKGYFAGAVNTGIGLCRTDVLVLNQDVWFSDYEWVSILSQARVEHGIVGEGVLANRAWPNGYVQGTFMFMRRDAIETVGLLNYRDYPLWGCTAEWQLRMCRKGFRSMPFRVVPGLQHESRGEGQFGSAITEAITREPSRRNEFLQTPPAISVIIMCHKDDRLLSDTISSLVGGQTCLGPMPGQIFQDFEIIIVDDGSTNQTRQACDKFEDHWKGIRAIHLTMMDRTATIDAAIQAAFGRAVIVIHEGYTAEPHWLETLFRKWEQNPARTRELEAGKTNCGLRTRD